MTDYERLVAEIESLGGRRVMQIGYTASVRWTTTKWELWVLDGVEFVIARRPSGRLELYDCVGDKDGQVENDMEYLRQRADDLRSLRSDLG